MLGPVISAVPAAQSGYVTAAAAAAAALMLLLLVLLLLLLMGLVGGVLGERAAVHEARFDGLAQQQVVVRRARAGPRRASRGGGGAPPRRPRRGLLLLPRHGSQRADREVRLHPGLDIDDRGSCQFKLAGRAAGPIVLTNIDGHRRTLTIQKAARRAPALAAPPPAATRRRRHSRFARAR
jgi:hypothetical protein